MQSEAETLCELWEEVPYEFPPHSRLYHLEPIGMGSPMVESLTSYVTRLADAHSVHPRVLATDEILPRLNVPYLYRDGSPMHDYLTSWWRGSAALNGTNESTSSFVQVLEQLTARQDLRFLTLLFWVEVLPTKGLLRRMRAWCPMCYREWHESDLVAYDPLLWTLEVITVCPLHRQQLQQRCPYPDCHRALPHLAPRAQPGHCSWCHRWLGNPIPNEGEIQKDAREEDWEWQEWVNSAMGELLSAAPSLLTPPKREALIATIVSFVKRVAGGNSATFAQVIRVDRTTLWCWVKGRYIPLTEALLRMCYHLGTSPLRFLTMGREEVDTIPETSTQRSVNADKPQKRCRKFETERVRAALEAVVQRTDDPPPSMREVAEGLGYHHSHLLRKFPELCRAISTRYLGYRAQKGKERVRRNCDEVRQVIFSLHEQGRYPSQRQVRYLLKKPGDLQEPEVYAMWKGMLKELGWQQ
jgi:hypothetical protein